MAGVGYPGGMSDEKETNAPAAPAKTVIAPPSMLSKPTDAAPRPGFRAPSNSKSKAQKKKR